MFNRFLLLGVVFSLPFLSGISNQINQFGNSSGGVWCTHAVYNSPCKGSYTNSTGCGAFSVTRYAYFGTATNLPSSVSQLNCNTNLDSAGVACKSQAEEEILPHAACWQHKKYVPFF